MYIGLHVKYPLFLSDLNENWIVWIDFRKVLKYQFCPVEDKLFHVDGQTNLTKPIVAFRNFANALSNGYNADNIYSRVSTVKQLNPVHSHTQNFSHIYLNMILSGAVFFFPSRSANKIMYAFLISYLTYIHILPS